MHCSDFFYSEKIIFIFPIHKLLFFHLNLFAEDNFSDSECQVLALELHQQEWVNFVKYFCQKDDR